MCQPHLAGDVKRRASIPRITSFKDDLISIVVHSCSHYRAGYRANQQGAAHIGTVVPIASVAAAAAMVAAVNIHIPGPVDVAVGVAINVAVGTAGVDALT